MYKSPLKTIDIIFKTVYTVYIQYKRGREYVLKLLISHTSSQPIYEQIKQQIKSQILQGVLKPGESLPSIRVLAKELNVSVITTKRAYEDLEREGFIISIPARGTFVAEIDKNSMILQYKKELEEDIKKIIKKANLLELKKEELIEMILKSFESEEK